jgi:hypothetical protein
MAEKISEAEEFFPKGAIVFFAGLLAFFTAVWLGLYAIMAARG